MDEDETQQFSLRWHNHQTSVIGALGRMLNSGALSDVTLSANGTSIRAHRLILASCSQYFAQLFKELETEGGALVVVLGCEAAELRLLLTFMYTGEVTASKSSLPSLLRLAQTLKVSGLTDSETNPTVTSNDAEITESCTYTNLETVREDLTELRDTLDGYSNQLGVQGDAKERESTSEQIGTDKDRLSKLDQIVQNLYSTHKITSPVDSAFTPPLLPGLGAVAAEPPGPCDRWRAGSVCGVCNKRLSNQYNLRVHMETHAGRRHACRACSHVSRSRDALRKHVAYRHAPGATATPRRSATARLDG
ncbi:unnamed protein product, partial [Iphiclides podalirius]